MKSVPNLLKTCKKGLQTAFFSDKVEMEKTGYGHSDIHRFYRKNFNIYLLFL